MDEHADYDVGGWDTGALFCESRALGYECELLAGHPGDHRAAMDLGVLLWDEQGRSRWRRREPHIGDRAAAGA